MPRSRFEYVAVVVVLTVATVLLFTVGKSRWGDEEGNLWILLWYGLLLVCWGVVALVGVISLARDVLRRLDK